VTSAKRATRMTGFSPVIAYAARRNFLRHRARALERYTPSIQAAFRAQRAAFLPYLSRVLDLRTTPNPTQREAFIRALLNPQPIKLALIPIWAEGMQEGSAFAATLLPACVKGSLPWWAAFEHKALASFDPSADDPELPPEVVAQFPRLGERISRSWQAINETTVQAITAQVEEGMRRGYTPLQIAQGFPRENFAGIDHQFDNAIDWRSEMIARTESAAAYNAGSWQRYSDAGVGKIQAVDGDEDRGCRERNGTIYDMDPLSGDPIDNGNGTEDHVNGTLTWFPLVETISAGG
jgi:hypothetical protein